MLCRETYARPLIEPILKRTHGIPIFPEQAMAIAMILGGYSGAEADELRRTMGHVRKASKLLVVLRQGRTSVQRNIRSANDNNNALLSRPFDAVIYYGSLTETRDKLVR